MFSIGDTVMHPAEGVCTVEEIRDMKFSGMPPRAYYVLRPSGEKASSVVYMPVARGDEVLRRLLSRADIISLIRRSLDAGDLWVSDSRMRKDAFTRLLSEGDYARIIRMIVLLHEARERRMAEGKKPCASDEALLTRAEQMLHQEFSYVLHLSPQQTVDFIRSELNAL